MALRAFAYPAAAVLGVILGVLVLVTNPEPPGGVVSGVVLEPPLDAVQEASVEVGLVQAGTLRAYTGTGNPGIVVTITGNASTVEWSLSAWATPARAGLLGVCPSEVHYGVHEWVLTDQDGAASWQSIPTTVPQRLAPGGDQCWLRIGEEGEWLVTVCIEGKPGGPRGYEAGVVDDWDRCESTVVEARAL